MHKALRRVTFSIDAQHAGAYRIEVTRSTGARWLWFKAARAPRQCIGRIVRIQWFHMEHGRQINRMKITLDHYMPVIEK